MFDPEDNKRTRVPNAAPGSVGGERPASLLHVAAAPMRTGSKPASLLDVAPAEDVKPVRKPRAASPKIASPQPEKKAARGLFGIFRRREKPAKSTEVLKSSVALPAAGNSVFDGRERPLIDLRIILTSVWRVRHMVVALTIVGAVGGVLLAMAAKSVYVAESKLYIDPREVQLTDSDLSKGALATEAILAIVDSQLEVLRSRGVLEKVATDLGLDRDAEFGKSAAASGAQPSAEVNPQTMDKLSQAITVARDQKTFIVTVQVATHDPAKSALIANRLVATFLAEERAAQSGYFQQTTAALDSRLSELRTELDTAETAVEKFKADHDIVGASGELISDKQLLALNDQVAAVRSRIADARGKVDVARKTQLSDVLSGAFPEELSSNTLQELRKQYAAARGQLGALDAALGPRHPQRLAAAQSLEVARSEVDNELRRIAATAQTELDRAVRTEQDLVQQLAVRKAQQVNSSTEFIELRELERKATATRTIYESFLKRASETGQEEKLTSKNIRIVSTAEPPLQPKGPSRKLIAIGGMLAGLVAGIGIGVALGIFRSLQGVFQPQRQAVIARREEDDATILEDGAEPLSNNDNSALEGSRSPRTLRRPSSHHVDASAAAASAFPHRHMDADAHDDHDLAARTRAHDEELAEVQDNLRALRSRVEQYANRRHYS